MSWIKLQSEHDDLDKYQDYHNSIYYYKKDTQIVHNPYGPAIIDKNGKTKFYIDGVLLGVKKLAIIWTNNKEEYCINDEYLTKEKFETHPERLKFIGKEHLICLT